MKPKSNRPVDLPLSQIIAVNAKSPVAMASILHRVSGIVLFLLIPVLLWVLQQSLVSESQFLSVLANPLVRFLVWIFVASTLYHFVMGMKHLFADLGMNEELNSGRVAAKVAFVIAFALIIASFFWVMF